MSRTDDNRAESFDEQDPADGDKKKSKRPASMSIIHHYILPTIPYLFSSQLPYHISH